MSTLRHHPICFRPFPELLAFMSKAKPQPKGTDTPEVSKTVGGKSLAGHDPIDHGSVRGESQMVTVQQTASSIVIPKTMSEAEYLALGSQLGEALQGASFRIGDYCNAGKELFGYKEYDKLAEATGLDQVYLRTCSSIAERVPAEYRQLASLERFRLMLPRREKVLVDGKPTTPEPIPALVARFDGWTQAEIRAGKKDEPKQLSAGATGSAAHTPDEPAGAGAGVPVESNPADAALQASTAPKTPEKGSMTATALYEMARTLQIGIELLTPERLALLSVMEQKFAVVKPLGAMCRLLSEQIRTELQK
jgi:hypothetical protein